MRLLYTVLPPPVDLMEKHGNRLADQLKELIRKKNYTGKLHFIAHSAGSYVSHIAVNSLVENYDIPVDHLTTLDAFQFDADTLLSEYDEMHLAWDLLSQENIQTILSKAVHNPFKIIPETKANFYDNYWAFVGTLSHILGLGALTNSNFFGVNAYIIEDFFGDNQTALPIIVKDKITNKDYFYKSSDVGLVNAVLHKPPVNWYMSSMVDQLKIAEYNPSGKEDEHQYGYYWSPLFAEHERADKHGIDCLVGSENYFDLFGSPDVVQDWIVEPYLVVEEAVTNAIEIGIEKGEEFIENLEDSVEEIGNSIKVNAAELWDDPAGWFSSTSEKIFHKKEGKDGYFWMQSGSPVALAGDYTIPEDGPYMAFFYKVLQADNTDSIDVFVNDEIVWSRTVESDLIKDIILSDWINVAQWMGQTVRLTFRINSFDGLPLTMELHDMVFAQIGDLEKIWNHDGDVDGMADMWEGLYLGDTTQDGNGDFDNDGLKNSEELASFICQFTLFTNHWL